VTQHGAFTDCPRCHGNPHAGIAADSACITCHGEQQYADDPDSPSMQLAQRYPWLWWAMAAIGALLIVGAKACA
jgi:cytochrome c553